MSPADEHRSEADWSAELDRFQALGMDLMVVAGLPLEPVAKDGTMPASAFFDEADRRGMRIFINTLSMPNWWTLTDPGPEIERAGKTIRSIADLYGKRPAFAGWYVPYELYVFWDGQADLIRALYRDVSRLCKETLDKPVMISPFFILDKGQKLGVFRWAEPTEYQVFWTDLLRQTSIDIVALQDSGEHLSCYSMEDRSPFFSAMKKACEASGKQFWANLETGELNVKSLDDYIARFGLGTHVNDPRLAEYWIGTPAKKLVEKLRFAGEFTPTAITWGYQEFVRPGSRPSAKALYDDYLALGLASTNP
jgi:hypothetical protein